MGWDGGWMDGWIDPGVPLHAPSTLDSTTPTTLNLTHSTTTTHHPFLKKQARTIVRAALEQAGGDIAKLALAFDGQKNAFTITDQVLGALFAVLGACLRVCVRVCVCVCSFFFLCFWLGCVRLVCVCVFWVGVGVSLSCACMHIPTRDPPHRPPQTNNN